MTDEPLTEEEIANYEVPRKYDWEGIVGAVVVIVLFGTYFALLCSGIELL